MPTNPLTLADFLELPAVARGNPELLVGVDALDVELRWFHISDLEHAARLVRGGEVLLSTGFGLPDTWDGIRRYVNALASADVRALCLTAGGLRYRDVPAPMIEIASRRELPLIRFRSKVRFVEISEQFANAHFDQRLRVIEADARERAHFSELLASGASVQRLTEEAGLMTGSTVLFETLGRRVVAAHGRADQLEWILADWLARSVSLSSTDHSTSVTNTEGNWVLANTWIADTPLGRMIAHNDGQGATNDIRRVLKRAAEATALTVSLAGGPEALAATSSRDIVNSVLSGRLTNFDELLARLSALGNDLPARGTRGLLPISLRLATDPSSDTAPEISLTERLRQVPRQGFRIAAVAPTGSAEISLLVAADVETDVVPLRTKVEDWLARALPLLEGTAALRVGLGPIATSVGELRRAMALASEVSEVQSKSIESGTGRINDRLSIAMSSLASNPIMQDVVEELLKPLGRLPPQKRQKAFEFLQAYARNDGNKERTAKALKCSRATVYTKLAELQALLSVDLDENNDRFTIDVACHVLGWRAESEALKDVTEPA